MKIFLSSTFEDLIDHRAKAAQAVERLGQHGIRIEVFGARLGEAAAIYLDEIHSSEAFVGIYSYRYGYTPDGLETTVTFENRRFAYDEQRFVTVAMCAAPWWQWSLSKQTTRSA